jgi:5,10-methylenetetrahydromethanopterin reductase
MRLGAQFLAQDFDEYLLSVQKAEEAGYEFAWIIDSQLLWQDFYVYAARGLAATERIVFGSAVTNPFTRHLTVTASGFGTLAQIHPGRIVLGIGRGDSAVRPMGLPPVRTKVLGEAIAVLQELLGGRSVQMNDTDVHLRWATEDLGVPIMLSATGPKNLRQAGRVADRVMLYVGVSAEAISWAMGHVRAGAEEAGRDPDDVKISILCAMRVSEDQEAAWEACRWSPAACANHIADMARNNPDNDMPEVMQRLIQSRDQYDYYDGHLDSGAQHTAYLTGELVDDFAISGPPEKCLEQLRVVADLGVDEVSVAYLNGEFDQMGRVGREIIPELAGLRAAS